MISARQFEVVAMLANGHSFKEIATKLRISVKTVDTHKHNAMLKLGLNSRVELFQWVRDSRGTNERAGA